MGNNGQVYNLVGRGPTWFGPDQTGVAPFPGSGGRSMCDGNGDVIKAFGSPEYVALGFSVVLMLILVELFGSPFMKNANVIIALLFGYFVAGVSRAEGNKFVPDTKIENAEPITFAWVENFPIGFYGPSVLPLLIAWSQRLKLSVISLPRTKRPRKTLNRKSLTNLSKVVYSRTAYAPSGRLWPPACLTPRFPKTTALSL